MANIKVILADDHPIVRQGLRALLEAEADIEVVGEASDGLTVADMVAKLAPDVLVLDLIMPGLNGLEVTRQVHRRSPFVQIIVLSMPGHQDYVQEALLNGAAACLLKESCIEALVPTIRTAMEGQPILQYLRALKKGKRFYEH